MRRSGSLNFGVVKNNKSQCFLTQCALFQHHKLESVYIDNNPLFFLYLRSNFETELINNNFKTKLKNDSAHTIPLSFFECVTTTNNNKKNACNQFPHFQLFKRGGGSDPGISYMD